MSFCQHPNSIVALRAGNGYYLGDTVAYMDLKSVPVCGSAIATPSSIKSLSGGAVCTTRKVCVVTRMLCCVWGGGKGGYVACNPHRMHALKRMEPTFICSFLLAPQNARLGIVVKKTGTVKNVVNVTLTPPVDGRGNTATVQITKVGVSRSACCTQGWHVWHGAPAAPTMYCPAHRCP